MLQHITSDGKKFTDLDEALKHESALGIAEKIAKEDERKKAEREKKLNQKQDDYNKMYAKIVEAKKAVQEYNDKYHDGIYISTRLVFNNTLPEDKTIQSGNTNASIKLTPNDYSGFSDFIKTFLDL